MVTSSVKPQLDVEALKNWPDITEPAISSNGMYVSYTIEEPFIGNRSLFVRAINGNWEKRFAGASDGFFSDNNRLFIYRSADTLSFLTLGTDSISRVSGILGTRSPELAKGKWVAYQLNNPEKELDLCKPYYWKKKTIQ
ncbi:hypothetical protein ACQ86N_01355 [Puia sp. P3]|uniref:hypothetical protein n=1 Tax=Puia sp. P3 TaxID=3423952 RepID=UPI003D673192